MSSSNGGPLPLPAWQAEVRILMNECKTIEVQLSPGSFIKALQSLHCKLIHPTIMPNEMADSSMELKSNLSTATKQQDFLRTIADELIELERVIFHIDEEIDGVHSSCIFDYEDTCEWYNDVLQKLARNDKGDECNACEESDGTQGLFNARLESNLNDPERCIDRCLDACGYTHSLDAAVDCLRRIVHNNSSTVSNSAPFQEERKNKGHGIIAAITSLRTVRRRLLLLPTSRIEEEGLDVVASFPKPYVEAILRLKDILNDQQMRHFQCMILPLAYHHNQRTYQYSKNSDQYETLDSLSSLARSVLPTLISAACHALNLPFPKWATPKCSYGIMFHYAWKCLLAVDLIRRSCPAEPSAQECVIVASNHFQSIVRQLIESGYSDVFAHQVYKCWKSFGNDPSPSHHCELATPRSILCLQLESTICFISSKRNAAIFCRAIIHDSAKMVILKSTSYDRLKQQARDQLDETSRANILPFLREVMLPSLVKDAALADALVQFIILSPPASYHSDTRSSQSFPTLQAIDLVVPRCLAQLLALTRDCESNSTKTESFQNVNGSDESDDDSINSTTKIIGFLSNIHTVASVWCEDVFVTRTDTLKQQYVTEFLLQPLNCNQLTQFDLKQSVFDDGTTLAAVLVQGVSLRLDVSRSESIRIDGMLVAEAMAAVLGQELKFDELHPPSCHNDGGISVTKATELLKPKKQPKKKNRMKQVLEPRAPVVVDPDALLSFNSDSSSCSSQHDSSTNSCDSSDDSSDSASSWGEDSLQPYALDDDEEDISRVPRPHTLRECLAYLTSTDDDAMAYDKQQAALSELTTIITAQPLDLHDVISMLVRILLHLEDKFGMDQFDENRWNSLMALGVSAPTETCLLLVGEMRGNISLCTRLDSLSLLKGIAQELSGTRRNDLPKQLMSSDQEMSRCSTKLRLARNQHETSNDGDNATSENPMQLAKTRRWRKERTPTTSTPNKFGAVAVQMVYSLLSFLSQTRTDEVIWGGAIEEQFLSEFLKTLCTMIYCASTYPSSSLLILAADLFDLAWIFHDAKSSEVRHASLLVMFTSISLLPLESVMQRAHGTGLFLRHCSERDESSDCRHIASLILGGSISEMMNENLIGGY